MCTRISWIRRKIEFQCESLFIERREFEHDEEFEQQRDSLVERGYDGDKIRKSTLYDFQGVKLEVDMSEPLAENLDDVMHNTMGCMIGCLMVKAARIMATNDSWFLRPLVASEQSRAKD